MDRSEKIKSVLNILEKNHLQYELDSETGTINIFNTSEITNLDANKQKKYLPKNIEICVDEKQYIFMQIDDYIWEFDDNFIAAKKEIESYMAALHENRLVLKGVRYVNQRLDIG